MPTFVGRQSDSKACVLALLLLSLVCEKAEDFSQAVTGIWYKNSNEHQEYLPGASAFHLLQALCFVIRWRKLDCLQTY